MMDHNYPLHAFHTNLVPHSMLMDHLIFLDDSGANWNTLQYQLCKNVILIQMLYCWTWKCVCHSDTKASAWVSKQKKSYKKHRKMHIKLTDEPGTNLQVAAATGDYI